MLWEYLVPYITIYSLNEDELQTYIGNTIDLLSPVQVYKALQELQNKLGVPVLVLHTRYWALAFGRNAYNYRDSLLNGITMATTRFRFAKLEEGKKEFNFQKVNIMKQSCYYRKKRELYSVMRSKNYQKIYVQYLQNL